MLLFNRQPTRSVVTFGTIRTTPVTHGNGVRAEPVGQGNDGPGNDGMGTRSSCFVLRSSFPVTARTSAFRLPPSQCPPSAAARILANPATEPRTTNHSTSSGSSCQKIFLPNLPDPINRSFLTLAGSQLTLDHTQRSMAKTANRTSGVGGWNTPRH